MDDLVLSTQPLLDHTPEMIRDLSCYFYVYRKRKSPYVFTTSIWKKNLGYVFNLTNSLVWWANNLPTLFPDYNIRIYFDNSIFAKQSVDRTEWKEIFNHILTFDNIELWFYNCISARSSECIGCHKGTYGSMIRFHAFDDPETKIIICHNLEYLTSPRDRDRTNLWLSDPEKKYHWYCFWSVYGQYGNMLEQNDEPTIIATFSARKNIGEKFDYFSIDIEEKYSDYPYGIDEYVLTKLMRPKMTLENTFITDCIYKISDVAWMLPKLQEIALEYLISMSRNSSHFNKNQVLNFLSTMDDDPDIGEQFVNYAKETLKTKNINKLTDAFEKQFHNFLFDNMIRGKLLITPQEFMSDKKESVCIYSFLTRSMINCIDFPGFCVKVKNFGLEGKITDRHSDIRRTMKKVTRLHNLGTLHTYLRKGTNMPN